VRYRSFLLAGLLVFISINATADQSDDSVFFQQHSQHAYNAVFGLPTVAPRTVQSLEWQISLEHSNQFAGGRTDNELLLLDGETTRLAISHRQRLGTCWQGEVVLPFLSHTSGKFDRAIDDWHQLFSLPDADRDETDFDSLTYLYEDANGLRHNINRPQSGIGDAQLAVQYALGCGATADSTHADPILRMGVKLPTGNANELRGSGEIDIFADWQSPIRRLRAKWYGAAALGILVNSNTARFANQENVAVYGSLGVQYAAWYNFRLIAQLDGHSPFYQSQLRELGTPSFNLALGARYLLSHSHTIEMSISEDAAIDTSPDIVARFAITYRPIVRAR